MAEGKYVKIGGAIKTVVGEYVKIGGAIKTCTTNAVKIDGAIKQISLEDRYVYTSESINDELYRLTNAGVEDWHYGLADATVVAVNADGESYWGVGTDLVKLNADGTHAWTYSGHSATIHSVALQNDSGIIYVYSGDYSGNVRRIIDVLPTIGLMWSVNVDAAYTPPVYALAVDNANGFVYAGVGVAAASRGVWRAAVSTGTFTKEYASASDISALAVDVNSPASVYLGDSAGNYRKMSADGYIYWSKSVGGTIPCIEIAHNGYGYLSCEAEKKVYKFTPSTGVMIWNYAPTPATSAYAYKIAVDAGGNVYAVYRYVGGSSGNYIYKIDKNGNYVWKWQSYVNVKFYGMAVMPGLAASGF